MVGTPGTVLDWVLKRRALDPSKIVLFVLDEADIMIDTQGHQDQTIRIHKWVELHCPMLTSPHLTSPPLADRPPTGQSTPTAKRLCSLPLTMKM